MRFDPELIKKETKEDFDSVWERGADFISTAPINDRFPRHHIKFGKPHPIYDTISKLRDAYMRMGFTEAMNPLIVEDRDIHKQFGHEALAVLDRCFYLSGLPRPNVGISDERIGEIKKLIPELDDDGIETIRKILHAYKKGEVEGDDLISEMAHALDVSDARVATMVDSIFPEFKELIPEATTKTLRSHMSSGWFISLGDMAQRAQLPVHMFSIDRCFRREQQEDATRLMTYYSASCVIMDEDVNVEDGKAVAAGLLEQFGFEKFVFRPDEKRSKYYIPDTQIEVFAYHPALVGSNTKYSDGWVEVATFGIYSPTALAQYDIPYPVMNLGLGVERLAMILHNSTDVRALAYPQSRQYSEWSMSDTELARAIYVDKVPETPFGLEVQNAIISTMEEHAHEESPCSFVAWEGEAFGHNITVSVVEHEDDTRLCGPAVFNEMIVHDGNISGVPDNKKWAKTRNKAVCTGMRFLDAFAALAAYECEKAAMDETGNDIKSETRARIIKSLGEINIKLEENAQLWIMSNNKKIDVRGPVFSMVSMELK